MWDFVSKPALVEKGVRINVVKTDECNGTTVKKLPTLYQRAVAAVQSRTHGHFDDKSSEAGFLEQMMMNNGKDNCPPPLPIMDVMLYPILDLLNGEKEEEYINVELVVRVDQDLIECEPCVPSTPEKSLLYPTERH